MAEKKTESKSTLNKDGFEAGKAVDPAAYAKFVAEQRNKTKK